jgi:glycosyltransferase involved in cell wall biosynthesis
MKKILFISTRNPFSNRYSGDVIGSKKIISVLKKKNKLDVVTLGKTENLSENNIYIFKYPSLFLKFIYMIKSLILFKPLQFSLFYSNKMKKFIYDRAEDYDLIFFYHIRSSQYLPKNYYGKKIIEMGDLYSDNYKQTFYNLNIFNPLKYIYFFESFLMKNMEKKIFSDFDKIILFSRHEIKEIDKSFRKKLYHINVSIDKVKKKYQFSKNNKKILFIGNLKYLPNILAVKSFTRNILPKLKKDLSDVKFEVIGEINNFDKFFLSSKYVKCWGSQNNLEKFIKGSFCGLANLEIATGIQGKILSYMTYGLPAICSKKVAINFGKNVISYNDESDLLVKIRKLKNDKKLGNQISKKSLRFVNKFSWQKIQKEYLKIIKD